MSEILILITAIIFFFLGRLSVKSNKEIKELVKKGLKKKVKTGGIKFDRERKEMSPQEKEMEKLIKEKLLKSEF